MSALVNLTYLSVVILLGLFCTWVSKKNKIPYMLPLLLVGIFLGNFQYKGSPLIHFPNMFTVSIALLALVMVVFDSASSFKYKDFDDFSLKALALTGTFVALNLVVLTIAAKLLFSLPNFYIAAIFAALMSGTSPVVVLTMINSGKNKALKLLEVEALLNTVFIVLIPFIIIDLMNTVGSARLATIVGQFVPFIQQFVTGIGAGLFVGIFIFKILKRGYSEVLSPLAVITAALITYVLAENLGGNGVLAVTIAGLIFGNVGLEGKTSLRSFSVIFATFLEILVFVLVGLLILIPKDILFFFKSIVLYAIFLFIRYVSLNITFKDDTFTRKEKLFMTFVSPKGIAEAAVAATFSSMVLDGMPVILNLVLLFLLYSLIVSTIFVKQSKKFLNINVVKTIK